MVDLYKHVYSMPLTAISTCTRLKKPDDEKLNEAYRPKQKKKVDSPLVAPLNCADNVRLEII